MTSFLLALDPPSRALQVPFESIPAAVQRIDAKAWTVVHAEHWMSLCSERRSTAVRYSQ
jgi:hypothetical protein